ncbi:MAG TPA: hypothetical protein VEQ59_18945, partial [Polyangiaceae bacterium]|nr:hypothetical protein [Polyangiaceae bacterium]
MAKPTKVFLCGSALATGSSLGGSNAAPAATGATAGKGCVSATAAGTGVAPGAEEGLSMAGAMPTRVCLPIGFRTAATAGIGAATAGIGAVTVPSLTVAGLGAATAATGPDA